MPLTYAGFDASVLSEFRTRLVAGNAEHLCFDSLLSQFRERRSWAAGDSGEPQAHDQAVSTCGEMVPKALSVRVHTCPVCGLVLGRDHNAALNMLQRGLQSLRLLHDECGAAHSEAQLL